MGADRAPTGPRILLTNDDGIEAPGIQALADHLASVGDVTVVAPRRNQSAVGRSLSYGRTAAETTADELSVNLAEGSFSAPVPHEDHPVGYAVDGTPCDCVVVGVNAFDWTPDLVVSGCNSGANLGAAVFGRSGTVSAAMEAAYLGVPAMAVSMDTLGLDRELDPADFAEAGTAAAALARRAGCDGGDAGDQGSGIFDRLDYLNVNVPRPDHATAGVAVTRPTDVYEMDAAYDGERFRLTNELWQQMAARNIPDPPDTDRHALLNRQLSVSPLGVPHEFVDGEAIEATIVDALDGVVDGA